MKRPITIASGQFGDLSLEELCKLVSSIGYEGIEIACQAHINVHKVLEDDAYVAQFRATLEKYGLKVWATTGTPAWITLPPTPSPASRTRFAHGRWKR